MGSAAKLFGCGINVEAKEEENRGGDSSVIGEVSRSGSIQPDNEALSMFVCFSPFNQMESNPCLPFAESNSASMDSGTDPHNCFIDFFDREFFRTSNQRVSSSGDLDIRGFHETEEDIELGLGIGSGSGDSGGVGFQVSGNMEIDSGRVEVDTGLAPVENNLSVEVGAMVVNEELEWEDLQNAIDWVQEPVVFSLEEEDEEEGEELSLASRDYDDNQYQNDVPWQLLLPVEFVEESGDTRGSFRFDVDTILSFMDEDVVVEEDYNAVLEQTFDNQSGIIGSPPASKRVVVGLPVVEFTCEELSTGNFVCAICKDDVLVEEKVKRLPCKHYYHGECIVPWLGIRNTCPVCRYELPTDDLDYERNRRSTQRRSSSGLESGLMSE